MLKAPCATSTTSRLPRVLLYNQAYSTAVEVKRRNVPTEMESSSPGIALATVGRRTVPLPQDWEPCAPFNVEELLTTAAVRH